LTRTDTTLKTAGLQGFLNESINSSLDGPFWNNKPKNYLQVNQQL